MSNVGVWASGSLEVNIAGPLAPARPMPPRSHGFTMMEMMVVISVLGILALLAAPWYMDRIVRDQIKEALPLADIAKTPVATSWSATKTLPADNAAAGLPVPEKIVANYVRSLAVNDG